MILIQHRVNEIQDLKTVPPEMGVEVDLREQSGEIILQHDPYKSGENFEGYLKQYRHKFMVLNIKTEGIEERVSGLIKKYGLKNYFFLDTAFPAMMKLIRQGETRIATRFSEYEPAELCAPLRGKVEWVWADCFTRLPWTQESYMSIKPFFKICLVSPELQQHPKEWISEFKTKLQNYPVDAVCTKYPGLWK